MTTEKMIAIVKEKLGKDITEQEAKDYISGKFALPDELLDVISGGADDGSSTVPETIICPKCHSTSVTILKEFERWYACQCNNCGNGWQHGKGYGQN